MVNALAAIVKDAGLYPIVIDVDSFEIKIAVESTGDSGVGRVVGLVNI
jgi:hypothetical protein